MSQEPDSHKFFSTEATKGLLPPEGSMENVPKASMENSGISRPKILERSLSWIEERVRYNQEKYHQNRYGRYRQDCSGYISLCWAQRTSYTTATIMRIAHRIVRDQLRTGDALWRRSGNQGHIALFVSWADEPRTRPVVREEYEYGRVCEQRIWSPAYASSFTPIRYNNIAEGPPATADGGEVAHNRVR